MIRIFSALILVMTFAACLKNDPPVLNCSEVTIKAAATETDSLQRYIDSNHIVATKDARGFFYHIDSATTGTKPNICNTIIVAYKGYFLSGLIFDQSTGASFNLSELITSWQEGLPLIGVGSTMTIYSPPSLAYGSQAHANGTIPANSYMKFVLTLKAVN